MLATQRPILTYRPEDATRAVPDLAAARPEVFANGLSVTVRLKQGIHFSPPVSREVTSRDVKYAIERGFFSSVASPYAALYFGDIVGARADVRPGTMIAGIETPDDRTIVFRLARPRAGTLIAAMVMPLTAPVPMEYGARHDARRRSTYATHQVATGPYMIRNDARGRLPGYRPGRRIHLVRNPNWVAATDIRPARLDAIDIRQRNSNSIRAARRILSGRRLVNGNIAVPVSELRPERRARRGQFSFANSGSVAFLALNTRLAPFDDSDVRRAVVAGYDRAGDVRLAGGRPSGVASHFIPPGLPGFKQAGGRRPRGLDIVSDPDGNRARAARYLRRAGFARGRYTRRRPIVMAADNDPAARDNIRYARRQFERLGFRVRLRVLAPERLFEVCGNPRALIHVCPYGWYRDFPDAQSVLDPLFNGRNILPRNNTNISQLNVPAINDAIDAAKGISDPADRATAWAAIDRQIVAEAPAVPLAWPRAANIRSRDLTGVLSESLGVWDYSFTALR